MPEDPSGVVTDRATTTATSDLRLTVRCGDSTMAELSADSQADHQANGEAANAIREGGISEAGIIKPDIGLGSGEW